MPIVWIVVLVVFGLVALVLTVGSFVPRNHSVSVRARYAKPPAEVWAVITDFEALPTWVPGMKSVERLPDVDGRPRWVEQFGHGTIPLQLVERDAPNRLVVRIDDVTGKMPFGGTWTWNLRAVPEGTELTLTENGFIRNVLFRFVANFFLGYTRMLESYLRGLGQKFGEVTEPRVV
jgi:uncharacterized protein YndB with AHSA1/START domain